MINEEMRINIFNEFMRRNWSYIIKELKYYSLDFEETKQECALVYFSFPEIEELYVSGKSKAASWIFLPKLRSSARKYSKNGKAVFNNESYSRQNSSTEKMETAHIVINNTIEDDIVELIDFDRIKAAIPEDKLEFALYYLTYGQAKTSIKYSISKTNVRTRYSRIVKKAKKDLGL